MYLNSYEIESRFYTHFAKDIEGVKIPFLYFNSEDTLNNKFGMILQDLSHCESGQPFGFSRSDCELCLEKLARFHASHWKHPVATSNLKMWDIGGYWTGSKREGNKKEIKQAWERVLKNFPTHFPVTGYTTQLGKRLYPQKTNMVHTFTV